ncbi:MAG: hypothetical protein JEZ04_21105 [Spirochaetales bacterium]|nr:hypothetical protein [Spirochaetales bacterium]
MKTQSQPSRGSKPPGDSNRIGRPYRCSWLYLPVSGLTPFPAVVLCHGFGGTKDFLLEQYALRFAAEGIVVLSVDYHHFGGSDGEPRQSFLFRNQEADLRASVSYLRSREDVICV